MSEISSFYNAPGPVGIRNTFHAARRMQREPLESYLALQGEYGDVVRLNLGRIQLMLFCHPDHLQHILRDKHHNYRKGIFNAPLVPLLGNGLLTSEGDFWLQQRRLAQPAFHRQRLEDLVDLVSSSVHPVLARWKKAADRQLPYDISPDMNALTLHIVGQALFGTDTQQIAPVLRDAFSTALAHVNYRSTHPNALPDWLPTPRGLQNRGAVKLLDRAVYAIIADRRTSGLNNRDLMGMLLEARDVETGAVMGDRQLRDEVITFLLAGHETTAHALSWTFALLARNPSAGRRLRAELDVVLRGRAPRMDDLPKLTYTRMVLDEVLRLYPPSVILPRQANQADVVGGYRVKENTAIVLSQYVTHRHAEFWPEPERFDPDRFAPETAAGRHKFAYLPFGAGPRICIGQQFALLEAQVILAQIAQSFDWELAPGETLEKEVAVTLRPRGGLRLLLRSL